MSDLLKSVIQDLINDRTEQAQVSIHSYIVGKTQEIVGLKEMMWDDDERRDFNRGLEDAKEQGIQDDVEQSVSSALSKAGFDVEVTLGGGGGYGDTHDYSGSASVHLEKPEDLEKLKTALAVMKKSFWVDNKYAESATFSSTIGGVSASEAKVKLEIQVTFVEEDAPQGDGDDDEDDDR